jgi:cytochrome c
MRLLSVAILALGIAGAATGANAQAAAGDAAEGEAVFKKCMTCHRIGEGAKNLVGPVLTGVLGRKAGTAEGFAYSVLNKNSGEAGLVWTDELVVKYLEDPNAFLKGFLTEKGKEDQISGVTKMVFKLADETERRNVVAYLKTFSK